MAARCEYCDDTGWMSDPNCEDWPMACAQVACRHCGSGGRAVMEQTKRLEIQNRTGGRLL